MLMPKHKKMNLITPSDKAVFVKYVRNMGERDLIRKVWWRLEVMSVFYVLSMSMAWGWPGELRLANLLCP